jgi:regulator of sigma E protease
MIPIDLLFTALLSFGAFLVAIAVIVTIHEFGHYIVGRWTGIEAEVFSIGFGREVLGFTDRRGTRWRLALIPAGGYVRFRGDLSPVSGPGGARTPGSFEGAPLRARSLTVAAGPAANFLFAILIIAGSALWTGLPSDVPTVGKARALPVASDLEPGDLILGVGGVPVSGLQDLRRAAEEIPPAAQVSWEVLREGERRMIEGPFPGIPVLGTVAPLSAAHRAGLREGDVILGIDGVKMVDFASVREAIGASGGRPVEVGLWRDGAEATLTLTPKRTDAVAEGGGFEARFMIGVGAGLPFEPALRRPGPAEAMRLGVEQTWQVISLNASAIGHLATGSIGVCNIRGVLAMGEISGARAVQGADDFVLFLALLSIVIGFMNLIPIPTLDGGHLLLHAWEALRGKPPSPKVAQTMMGIGMMALVGLMTLGLVNDLLC